MYEAPDRYKRMISARLPGGESLGLTNHPDEDDNTPLKDIQLISRAQLAPFFAAANIVAAAMMVAALWGEVDPAWLLPWAVAVALINLGAMQLARMQSITHIGRSGRRVPLWQMVGDVGIRRSRSARHRVHARGTLATCDRSRAHGAAHRRSHRSGAAGVDGGDTRACRARSRLARSA